MQIGVAIGIVGDIGTRSLGQQVLNLLLLALLLLYGENTEARASAHILTICVGLSPSCLLYFYFRPKVHILTLHARASAQALRRHTRFSCLTGTKVQILTLHARLSPNSSSA
jgi:hypothetical protein